MCSTWKYPPKKAWLIKVSFFNNWIWRQLVVEPDLIIKKTCSSFFDEQFVKHFFHPGILHSTTLKGFLNICFRHVQNQKTHFRMLFVECCFKIIKCSPLIIIICYCVVSLWQRMVFRALCLFRAVSHFTDILYFASYWTSTLPILMLRVHVQWSASWELGAMQSNNEKNTCRVR